MAKTLITWPPGSVDGKREAERLHALYPAVSKAVDGAVLGSETSKDFSLLVVVGHRDEIKAVDVPKSLARCVTALGIRYVTLANATGAAVLATTRDLLFDEVGQGRVFAGSADRAPTPINPSGETLWKEFRKQDPVDEITEGVSHL